MAKHLNKVDHSYIRYANCWEDADLLLAGLEPNEGDKILSIGSAGDNCFSLLTGNPALVVAIDINQAQLELIHLKKACFQVLSHKEFLAFLGFIDCRDRELLFAKVKSKLTDDQITYWEERKDLINDGLIYQGKFEQYFRHFRTKLLPFVHSIERIDELFAEKNAKDQLAYFSSKWNNLRWRTVFKFFFSKTIMGWLGRDPKFLAEVDIPVSDFILRQAEQELENPNCQSNYFLQFILKGHFDSHLPHYAREENYDKIVANVDNLKVVKGYAEDAINVYGRFNKFNLSNIFEYMDGQAFESVVLALKNGALPKAKFAYWNLMVPRAMSLVSDKIKDLSPTNYADRGFFYSSFHLNQLS